MSRRKRNYITEWENSYLLYFLTQKNTKSEVHPYVILVQSFGKFLTNLEIFDSVKKLVKVKISVILIGQLVDWDFSSL